ncbi:MAG: RNA polymerase sigma factor [Ignavibacteriae bacterium]|nr:RNA polymerase sigma factor [Ignavibacteriota bacterium]
MDVLALVLENDSEIIKNYTEHKSEAAATAFVRKHQNFVFSTALRYLQSYDDADDASQEVFIKALNNLHKFRGDSNVKTWLYRITANVAANMRRKKKILNFMRLDFSDNDEDNSNTLINLYASDNDSPLDKIEKKENEEALLNVLKKLPEKQRETFSLRYFDQMSYEEISKVLGTSVGGLKANYYHAVKKITQELKSLSGL